MSKQGEGCLTVGVRPPPDTDRTSTRRGPDGVRLGGLLRQFTYFTIDTPPLRTFPSVRGRGSETTSGVADTGDEPLLGSILVEPHPSRESTLTSKRRFQNLI